MIRVVAVGRLKARWAQEACADYARRAGRFAHLEVIEVPDREPVEEGRRLLEAARGEPRLACDPAGELLSSEDLARLLGRFGSPCFLIGGPDGLSAEVTARCDRSLSLGPLTLPHELARLVLLEQIYRGLSILKGHPYHR
jgi:23S rRNA (pseudouridine1915-N3)-methyltransferase